MAKLYRALFFGVLPVFLSVSCLSSPSYNLQDPYPGMVTIPYEAGTVYEFSNESSDKLIIHLEGNNWDSVLGQKKGDEWTTLHVGAYLLPVLRERYTVLILEKWDRQPEKYYYNDLDARLLYTMENLVACYTAEIDSYLAEHSYSSIVLMGTSEGAALLPLVYEKMKEKALVSAMIANGFGGLSFHESLQILSRSPRIPPDLQAIYTHILYNYDQHIDVYSDSIGISEYGPVLRTMSSLMEIRPFDYYRAITIPMLFIHGIDDRDFPVESTRYIQENLPDKPFEYRYYPWGHEPSGHSEILEFRNTIAEWILTQGL